MFLFISIPFLIFHSIHIFLVISYSKYNVHVVFLQSVPVADFGKPAHQHVFKLNIVVFSLFDVEGVSIRAVVSDLCPPMEDPDSGLKQTMHDHPWLAIRAATNGPLVGPIFWMP